MNPYTSYNSYAYPNSRIPSPTSSFRTQQRFTSTRLPPVSSNLMSQPGSSGEVSRKTMIIVSVVLIVIILLWLGLNFLLYEKKTAWFKVYKAPPPPSNSVQPNGDGTGGKLDPAVTTFKNQQLSGYQALAPGSTPSEFGGYITTPPQP